jgi:hypothetical protein
MAILSRGRMIWFLAFPQPPPPPLQGVSQLDRREERQFADATGGGRGAESYDRKKACSQIHTCA